MRGETHERKSTMRLILLAVVSLLPLLNGPALAEDAAPQKVKLALNWKPEPEFGGFYAAKENGAFAKQGLEVQITAALDQVMPMLESGQAEFGILAADEVMAARANGVDLVAVFAIYQTNPQGIMVHPDRGFKSLADVMQNSGTLAVQPGLKYSDFLKHKYAPAKVKLVPYDFSIAQFLDDPNHSQQCFVTSEPIAAARKGTQSQVFLIAESGFNPYAGLVVVRGEYLKNNRTIVERFVNAARQGWRAYLDDSKPTDKVMAKLNKEMDLQTFHDGAAKQKPLIDDEFTQAHGLGAMSKERWETLGKQLVELKAIKQAPPAEECFVNPVR